MNLLAVFSEEFLATAAAPALRLVLGFACVFPPALVWLRSRWWPQPTRAAVRATSLFASTCGLIALLSWYPLAGRDPRAAGAGLAALTALALAGVALMVWAFRRRVEPGWQLYLPRLRVLDTALNASQDGVLIAKYDPNAVGLQIVYANPAFEALTGYGTEEALGRSPSILCNENSKSDRNGVDTALRMGTPGRFEVHTRRKDGSRVWVEWNVVPVPDGDDGCAYRIAVLRDITERRGLEDRLRQAAKLEAVGRLSAGIAHDFNNLLTVIRGSADLLLPGAEEVPGAAHLVGEIQFASDRASWLIRQLLTFSRPETAAREVLDLNRVAADLTGLLCRILGPGIKTEVNLPREALWVEADRSQLEQVIVNLAVNARDAMPAGGRLRLALGRAGDRARLEVDDTGCGIPEEVKPRIFEPFFTTKGPDKGTGLGLATVQRIVQQSGGSIAVESAPGVGTCFRIELPLSSAAPPASAPRREEDRPANRRASVLLVDDEPGVRTLARAILESRGLRVTEAADGLDAIALLESEGRFDLVLTDMTMPRAGGDCVAARAREIQPDIGVVFISGYSEREPSAPGSIFLSKPFSTADLISAVEKVLAARSEKKALAEALAAEPVACPC